MPNSCIDSSARVSHRPRSGFLIQHDIDLAHREKAKIWTKIKNSTVAGCRKLTDSEFDKLWRTRAKPDDVRDYDDVCEKLESLFAEMQSFNQLRSAFLETLPATKDKADRTQLTGIASPVRQISDQRGSATQMSARRRLHALIQHDIKIASRDKVAIWSRILNATTRGRRRLTDSEIQSLWRTSAKADDVRAYDELCQKLESLSVEMQSFDGERSGCWPISGDNPDPKSGRPISWPEAPPTQIMWAPAGIHRIRPRAWVKSLNRFVVLELTVDINPFALDRINACLRYLKAKGLAPFADYEHRGATFRAFSAGKFFWSDSPKSGLVIECVAWTELGTRLFWANHVQALSPTAVYDILMEDGREEGGLLKFSNGVRGSAENPAEIFGVRENIGGLVYDSAYENTAHFIQSDASKEAVRAIINKALFP